MRKQVEIYIAETYGVVPELLWKDSDAAAIRHNADKKWFGIIMPGIAWRKLGVDRDGAVEVMNVKCDPVILPSLVDGQGLFPAYHMNKQHWNSVKPDGKVPEELMRYMLDQSYSLILNSFSKKKQQEILK